VRGRLDIAIGLVTTALLGGCGNAGQSPTAACSLCGTMNDLSGALASSNGSQSEMQGWVVAAFEYDTGIARVSEANSAGVYTLKQVRTSEPLTFVVLTPDYIVQAVTSIPNDSKTIHQFVYAQLPTLPKLIVNGPQANLESVTGLTVHPEVASAQKGDGTPDGATQITGKTSLTDDELAFHRVTADEAFGSMDLLDSIPTPPADAHNQDPRKDPDIDGDGLINWIDADDNGNGILDVFDPDQNSDLVPDNTPSGHNTDAWFSAGVQYVATQFELVPKTTGSGNDAYLKFNVKVMDDTTPTAVQIRGAPSLLNGSTYTALDTQGNPQQVQWTKLLNDDGKSEDGAAGDRVFGQKVALASGKLPRANEMIFFELVMGSAANPWYIDYPVTFPPITPAGITAQYASNGATAKNVLLVGNPFSNAAGPIQDFVWTINVYDSKDTTTPIWTSESIPGTTRTYTITADIWDPAETYKYEVIAKSLEKVPGLPMFVVHSPLYDAK
jgi:hypothetical protein